LVQQVRERLPRLQVIWADGAYSKGRTRDPMLDPMAFHAPVCANDFFLGSCAMNVAIVGPFDRFNYGDLLFPFVIENLLKACNCCVEAEFYGTIKSNLRRYGAKKSKAISSLFKPQAMPEGSVAILARVDVLAEDWTSAVDTLLQIFASVVLGCVRNRCGTTVSNALCRAVLRVPLEFPWIVASRDFPNPVKVAYNCVGGTGLTDLPAAIRKRIEDSLAMATFVSVRDNQTQSLLKSVAPDGGVRLAPDSGILYHILCAFTL
jgi:hypothetical protein